MSLQTPIPSFSSSPAPDRRTDYSSRGGAELLAQRIRRIWELLGYIIVVWVEPVTGTAGIEGHNGKQAWGVRSNLRNGIPREW